MLSSEQLDSWHNDGVLVLPGFYAGSELDAVDNAMRAVWKRRDSRVVVDDLLTNRRCLLSALSNEELSHRFKTNDLYLTEEPVRWLAMGQRMAPLIEALLGQTPVLCNSLNFDQGSAQPAHVDSLYMTPRTPGHLCAIWVALEDVTTQAGPLFYFRGSHKLPRHTFSDGTHHAIESEMAAWHARMDRAVQEHGLKRETFLAKRGDVFIWSSDLLHGGSDIIDPSQTRRSVVFHYLSRPDCVRAGAKLQPINNGFWLDRPRQPVPEDRLKARGTDAIPKHASDAQAELHRRRDPYRIRLAAARIRKWSRTEPRLSFVRALLRKLG